MKGDLSYLTPATAANDTAVLHQQGRVLLDRDWNEAVAIDARWRDAAGRDAFGAGVLAVPSSRVDAFRVLRAQTDGRGVRVELQPGTAWADGLAISIRAPAVREATYLAPPFQAAQESAATIVDGTRDLVVLDVWEDVVSGFQEPADLIEPALGGPDTTERVRAFMAARLIRLGPNDDCSVVASAADNFDTRGRLTVKPAQVITIAGDCPVDTGGGYTGLEHYLYRVEIADPVGQNPRFKWSQFNGGLVGRGEYTRVNATTGTVNITANAQMILHCGLPTFYLEALRYDDLAGQWVIAFTADAAIQNGGLSLTNAVGAWPVETTDAFFRLWNGIRRVSSFGPAATELERGILLAFANPFNGARYVPGDYWTFPVRAQGATFDVGKWPTNAPPHGVRHRRVALGIVTWGADQTALHSRDDIDDCRRIFRPLTNQKVCCTFNVGDGVSTHGDFDSIEEALRHLPAAGGEICLLPGLHETNALIDGRVGVTIKGCGARTRVIPRRRAPNLPIFRIVNSSRVCLDHMEMTTLGGSAIVVEGTQSGGASDIEIVRNSILACQNAIRVVNGDGVNIHENRIRMLDKPNAGVAIYLAADDSLIERNDIRLVPWRQTPPFVIPDDPKPVDVSDPCAKPEIAYMNRRLFARYLVDVWALALPHHPPQGDPYRALGGIQVGAGSERVRVLENVVVGGAGNGITLGTAAPPPPPPPVWPEFGVIVMPHAGTFILGVVRGPKGPLAGAQVMRTSTTSAAAPMTEFTNENGEFRIPIGNNGTYRVTVASVGLELEGFSGPVVTDGVNGGRGYQLTIRMRVPVAPVGDESGFLYDIAIERNDLSAMGLSGIGVVTQRVGRAAAAGAVERIGPVANARRMLPTPVIRLAIRGNQIRTCLRNAFDRELLEEATTQGLGGISLGLCEDLLIAENRIERNGINGMNPVCGIFVTYGETVSITHNHIMDNGVILPGRSAIRGVRPGMRGGIVLNLATSFSALDTLRSDRIRETNRMPAARIHANVVDQPVGLALSVRAIGPVMCSDNAFASDRSGVGSADSKAGTVWILNLGGVQFAEPGRKIKARAAMEMAGAGAAAPAAAPAVAARATRVDATFARSEAAERLLPAGSTQFHDNQSRTGPANTSPTCHIIFAQDDLGYQGNQSACDGRRDLFANVYLVGLTVRAALNRMTEQGPETLASLHTIGVRMNNTSFNQGDHCILATDMNATMSEVKLGNQVLYPSGLCARRSATVMGTFKGIKVGR